ncbi:hypothetical protein [Desulfosarcina sp.]|uniref:hypothetical protein n=1 Tax=Desulfosarcina sp. TaxID=2027861 RepID=UPI003970F810
MTDQKKGQDPMQGPCPNLNGENLLSSVVAKSRISSVQLIGVLFPVIKGRIGIFRCDFSLAAKKLRDRKECEISQGKLPSIQSENVIFDTKASSLP